ncbi:YhgE/Pip domain-containing protein [uncultured Ruminococcus sp.]|uniref:YhgE/Pip domain-containing protein n=1 Tax=uncultured Ruminococcus sp. TaxID=165186 RepID=UPI0025DC9D6C|nr:YhgE/Pip domain-containing protein [uncultured Ruminococcus sp.]
MRSSGSGKQQNFFWRHFNGIAMAAIVLIPTIYTTLFLGSMWDPYGNVDQLPVAVVNNDKSVDYEGKELAVGDELVDKLRENDQLDFHFVSADKAEKGIEDGTYYMVITIPENFSENASTLMDDEPQKMELQYVTNPGTNYIASKMSETALAKIQKEVSESVTKEYTETIFDQLGTIGSGMSDAADGALQIQDGVSDLKDGNTKITDNLKLLSDSSLTFVDGAKTLESGLKTYTDGVATVNSGAQTLSDGMDQLASGAGTLADGAVALSDGSGTLSNGVSSYTDGVSAAYSGAQTLDGSSSQLENGAASLTSGAAQLQQGSAQMTAGLQTLSDSLSGSLSAESLQQMQQLTAGLTQLQQGIDTLNTTLQNTSMPDTSALVQTLTASLTAIGTSAQDAGAQLQSLQSALTTMTQTEVFQSLDAASQQELLSCFSVPMSSLATDISDIGTQVTGLSKALEGTDLSSSASAMEQLKSSVSTLAAGADQALPGAQQAITSLSGGLQSVQSAVDAQLIPGSQALEAGLSQLADGSSTLEYGVSKYTGGVSSLTDGLQTLDSNTGTLVGGASSLNSGAQTLADSVPTLTNAVSQLQSGASQLADGTAQLAANNDTLNSGAAQLADGAGQIQDGASQLADGSVELGDGLVQLSNGAVTLQTSIADGADEVNSIDSTDKTYDMFSAPVMTNETYETTVPTNGNAMAAYMMSVGLWVSGLAFCVMLSPYHQKIGARKPGKAWLLTLGKLWALGLLQAVLMILCLSWINDFQPEYMGKTLIIACLASVAFLTLEYCVNFFLDIIGDFILLVFMVLQLSGCAGTYPLELSDKFYQVLNPFMPFTYTVHGFRSGIASGLDITTDCVVLAVIAVVFAGLLLVGFRKRAKKEQESEVEVSEKAVSGTPVQA